MFNNNITDVFFDLDHTLWDFEKNSTITFQIIFQKHNITIPLLEFMDVYRPVNIKYWEMYRKNKINTVDLRYHRLKEVFEQLGVKTDKSFIDLLSKEYIANLSNQTHLCNGAKETLEYLSKKYTIHLLTNGFEAIQNKKLISSGIQHYFKTITTAEGSGFKKPDKRIFAYALHQANTTPSKSIMIGDNIEADIKGAKEFGMSTIYFGKKPNFENEHVASLIDILQLL